MSGERRLQWLAPGALALAFLPFLGGDFVWDDVPLIRHNPAMISASGYRELVTRDLWGQATGAPSQLYHPLPMLSLWLQTQLHGLHIVPLRLVNLGLHALVGWLLVGLLTRLGVARLLALATGLAVLVHPSVCEPVMWLTGRHDTLGVIGVLLALRAWPAPDRIRRRKLQAFMSGCLLALAFLSKEPYIVGPALLAAFAAWQSWRVARSPLAADSGPVLADLARIGRHTSAELALALLPLCAALALRRALGISLGSTQLHATLLEHARSYASITAHYGVQLLGLQNGSTILHYQPLSWPLVAATWLVLLGVLVLLTWATVRSPRGEPVYATALFGYVWFLVALAPHVISVPTIGLYGNRYGYCALLGLAISMAALSTRLPALAPHQARIAWGLYAALLTITALRTGIDAARWRDNETLYSADVARDPRDGYALYHLATAVLTKHGCESALPLFVHATELAPRYERPYHNVTGCLINLGRPAEARPFAERSVALAPHNARAHYNLAVTLAARDERAEAALHLQTALRLEPGFAPAQSASAALK
ncbi:MAG: hypothetical protein ABW321_21670 [Polyangiales bacterium]